MNGYRNQRTGSGGQRPPYGQQRGPRPPKELPSPTTVTYYRDNVLISELMDSEAEAVARQLQSVTTTQLRRFYEDVLNLRQRMPLDPKKAEAAWEHLRTDFKMLKAKAVYANGRSEKTFPKELLQFFIDHVHSVQTVKDFEAFCKHFQAVVAFHRYFREQKD